MEKRKVKMEIVIKKERCDAYIPTYRPTDRRTDRQTDNQVDRQTDNVDTASR